MINLFTNNSELRAFRLRSPYGVRLLLWVSSFLNAAFCGGGRRSTWDRESQEFVSEIRDESTEFCDLGHHHDSDHLEKSFGRQDVV